MQGTINKKKDISYLSPFCRSGVHLSFRTIGLQANQNVPGIQSFTVQDGTFK